MPASWAFQGICKILYMLLFDEFKGYSIAIIT
jgi:hypothetical protein